MLKRFFHGARYLALVPLLLVVFMSTALAQSEQQKVVNLADATLINFLRDPQMTWLQNNIGRAKGVLIASNVVKAGFIFGGSGGRAVLITRDPKTGKWLGPAFYTLATASVGFQAGVQVSEIVTLVMTEKGMRSLLATSVKLGPDVGIAAGPVGAGATADIISDLVSFSRSKGVYGGVNLDGTAVTVSDDWNRAYYGKDVQPADIVVSASIHNKQADKLLADAARGVRGK
jgi:lipid-binding SYLF domain-containing protein